MKNHGRVGDPMKFLHDYIGSNYKTTEFCAGICYAQMKNADKLIKKRQDNAKYLKKHINNWFLTPYPVNKNYSLLGYTIEAFCIRDSICKTLNDNGIETRNMFPCLATQISYMSDYNIDKYPVARHVGDHHFYIGCHQYMTKAELKKIVKVLNK